MFNVKSRRAIRALGTTASVVLACGLPLLAFGQSSPFQTGAQSIVTNFITIATPIATIVVMALGVAAIAGRISWAWAIGAVIGVAIIFGAPTLVTWVRGLFGV